jgi:hypothetical protein
MAETFIVPSNTDLNQSRTQEGKEWTYGLKDSRSGPHNARYTRPWVANIYRALSSDGRVFIVQYE